MTFFRASFLLCLIVTGCTSVPKRSPVKLPVELTSLVRSCAELDGSANAQGFHKKELKGALDVEWLASAGEWKLEAIDPMARTLLTLSYNVETGTFTRSGPLAARLPLLETEQGFLQVDGNFTGLRPAELPCYWSGYFPESEASKVYDVRRSKQGFVLEHGDDERTVTSAIDYLSPDKKQYQLCSDIRWTRLFGLIRRNIVLCTKKTDQLSGTMSILDNDFRIHWVSLDEHE